MNLSKRTSSWSVEEVLEWIQEQHPTHLNTLHKSIIKHDIAGRALLRLKEHHLELFGLEDEEQQQKVLRDLLLLKVQEEICELCDICSDLAITSQSLHESAERFCRQPSRLQIERSPDVSQDDLSVVSLGRRSQVLSRRRSEEEENLTLLEK